MPLRREPRLSTAAARQRGRRSSLLPVSGTAAAPGCAGSSGDPTAVYFFGTTAQAVLGVGMRVARNLASPLAATGTRGQYVFAMDPLGSGTGALLIDPSAATAARFAASTAQLAATGTTASGGTVASA